MSRSSTWAARGLLFLTRRWLFPSFGALATLSLSLSRGEISVVLVFFFFVDARLVFVVLLLFWRLSFLRFLRLLREKRGPAVRHLENELQPPIMANTQFTMQVVLSVFAGPCRSWRGIWVWGRRVCLSLSLSLCVCVSVCVCERREVYLGTTRK